MITRSTCQWNHAHKLRRVSIERGVHCNGSLHVVAPVSLLCVLSWSTGCILAELHGRKPLFPGDDYIKQMNLIFSVLGTPSKSDMKFITNEKALEYIKSLKKQPKIPFNKIYKDANPLALDLLDKMLIFNPHERITVDEGEKRTEQRAGEQSAAKSMVRKQRMF